MSRRHAFTLIELIIVFAILGTLFGLLLGAIQVVRESALRAKSMNNLRQIALGFHSYAAQHEGRLPEEERIGEGGWRSRLSTIVMNVEGRAKAPIQWLLSPADPTIDLEHNGLGQTSYAMNYQVFSIPKAAIPNSISDGTSNTLMLGEIYAVCDGLPSSWGSDNFHNRPAFFAWAYCPVTTGSPPVSRCIRPGLTFQVRPCTKENRHCGTTTPCNQSMAQTPHKNGMLVALVDGGVRPISANISETTYWALVTPNSGELVGNDW